MYTYIGKNGAHCPNIPARDLTPEDIAQCVMVFGLSEQKFIDEWVLKCGLYKGATTQKSTKREVSVQPQIEEPKPKKGG